MKKESIGVRSMKPQGYLIYLGRRLITHFEKRICSDSFPKGDLTFIGSIMKKNSNPNKS
jgi:hypothetical protein